VKVQKLAEEAENEQQVLGAGGKRRRSRLGFVEPAEQFADVVANRGDALPGDFFPDEVGDQEPEQQLTLDGSEQDGSPGPGVERFETLVRQRVNGALAGLARLCARRQIAELGQPLGLDVVLALPRPAEDPNTSSPRCTAPIPTCASASMT
jgi:hypothetical protein